MTLESGLVLLILLGAIILFASERIRVDLVSLMVLLALLLTGLITAAEAFSGFSNPAVITVWAIYIVSASLTRTGIADFIGRYVGMVGGKSETRLLLVLMLTVGTMSAFMNNIGAAAVLLPVTVTLGQRANIAPSRLLIPLAFGSLLGGVTTLIGTPPNLLASDALREAGLGPFSLFDFTPMGLIVMGCGVAYMVLIGRRLLPTHTGHEHQRDNLTNEYELDGYLSEVHVLPESPLIGKTITETQFGQTHDLTVIGIMQNGRLQSGALPDTRIHSGDILMVKGATEQILKISRSTSMMLIPDDLRDADLRTVDATVTEVVISQLANFIGKSVNDIDFRGRYGLTVLAIWRQESPIVGRMANVPLRFGDTLLVQGKRERIEAIRDDPAFLLLRPPKAPSRRLSKAPINLVIFLSMITLVGLGILHISAAAVLGAVLSVLAGCLTMDEAYNAIEWKSVFLIAGMLPMGIAMEKTGTAVFLADQIISITGPFGPRGIMLGIFVLTTILTAFMSNAAAAVLVAPIAIQTAFNLGLAPQAFVMGTAIAASNSFITPIGHQVCILVYGPGGYRFSDFARVGLPLTLLIWLVCIIFLPIFWPL